MSRKKIIISIIIILLVVVGIAVYVSRMHNENAKGITVETAVIGKNEVIEKVSATGKIQPETEVKISSEVSGEVIDLPVKEGQLVAKGDLLVRINPDLYQSSIDRSVASLATSKASLNQAEAQLKEAKQNYDRNKILLDKGVISRSEWDKIVSTYEVAAASKNSAYYNVQASQATVTEARDQLNRTTIYAPVAGTISRLDVELGERVLGTQQMAGTEIMRVANLDHMEVEVDVNENDIVKIAVGNEAVIEVDAYQKKEFKGVVTSISNSADANLTADQVTNFKVKVRILKESYEDLLEGRPETYSPFRPGMTATVDIISKRKTDIFTVPISAVVMKSDKDKADAPADSSENLKEAVFINENGKAVLRFVKTGIQDTQNIEIIDGLKQGESVIVGPYSTVTKDLKDGSMIHTEKK